MIDRWEVERSRAGKFLYQTRPHVATASYRLPRFPIWVLRSMTGTMRSLPPSPFLVWFGLGSDKMERERERYAIVIGEDVVCGWVHSGCAGVNVSLGEKGRVLDSWDLISSLSSSSLWGSSKVVVRRLHYPKK